MPGDPNECREHAKCCLKHAAVASNTMVRDNFLTLAQSWMRLARELDASERLLAGLKKLPPEEAPQLAAVTPSMVEVPEVPA